ncbi:DUF1549 and DUF1553 domain-containing protein [Tautonia plasticadhaerens]|uniref:Bacterial Ig-like domain (Group 2) n=1 Tax=Tautonia plasticadhaerens TaxID=2527974 RepID=A0A518GYQ9_9BACT|nr:DUF1549 and DUF1553 domain-containing protein [Tautonia plasticadhaerens]QDV33738.1 hypothetical protein ElP_16170 [Tautonia plasticadhaerens]
MTRRPSPTARRTPPLALALAAALAPLPLSPAVVLGGETPALLTVEPAEVRLDGSRDEAQLIVTGYFDDGSVRDLTAVAEFTSPGAPVVEVYPGGLIRPASAGQARVVARVGTAEAAAAVTVERAGVEHARRFEVEVQPALTKAGCNQGACHGTPTGKEGFRLSLRGFDPDLDHATLSREVGSRRVNPFDPESSLVLLKGTGAVAHEGGRRFGPDDPTYRILRDWIAEGLAAEPEGLPVPTRLEVLPGDRVLDAPAESQQLAARLHFEDGTVRDVTRLARYESSDATVATIGPGGMARKAGTGEATVLVNFGSLVATTRLVFREPVDGLAWTDPPNANFIDEHLSSKLELLRIPPSRSCDDATFLRRAHLDLIGLPPTPGEIRAFLADDRPDRRALVIDGLLGRPEYVDFWAMKWADRLGCNQRFTGHKGAYSYYRWIRDQVAANIPFDEFARAIVTADGPNYVNPPASFYRRIRDPEEAVETVSQVFLGLRLRCARCHNHVADRWTQDDYYGMAAFFSQVRYKNGPQFFETYDKEETVYLQPDREIRQPRTGRVMAPKPLGAPAVALERDEDRREALADWITAPENPFFARAAVNRIWFHLMGRGIVDPVDDLRASNPPISEGLMDALADDFASHGFDVKRTIRLICASRAYQRSAEPNAFNADDDRYFSRATVALLPAEVLLDAISQAAGVDEQLGHLPPGTRAVEVPDGEFSHPFLRTFGRPSRSEACECERERDSTLEQALQLVGGRTVHEKVAEEDNRIGRLMASGAGDEAIVEELFLATVCRPPSDEESALVTPRLAEATDQADRRRVAEDLLWSLLNHPEFLFRH